jgi:hypothetical protein
MKNVKATEKYNFNELNFLANMNLINDIKEMFGGIMDERIAAGKMPVENKDKATAMISVYLDYVWEQTMVVAYYTLCELYDYLAGGDLASALHMVQNKSIVTVIA